MRESLCSLMACPTWREREEWFVFRMEGQELEGRVTVATNVGKRYPGVEKGVE